MSARDVIYGYDKEEGIVKIETNAAGNHVEIFSRKDGVLTSRYETLSYKAYVNEKDKKLVSAFDTKRLKGDNFFNLEVTVDDNNHFRQLRNLTDVNAPFLQSQFMLQTGKTPFIGMEFNDPVVVFFDIETLTTKGFSFPNADREGDMITIIAMKSNKGHKFVFHLGESGIDKKGDTMYYACSTESDLLEEFIYQLRLIDPDVIANHNIFHFDLPYIEKRARMLGVDLALGRNGSAPESFSTSIKFADRAREYDNYMIYGRTVIDTMFLAQQADVSLRSMPSYGLKDIVKFLGRAQDDRVYIEGDEISDVWRGEHEHHTREDLLDYAIDDVIEAEVVYNEFGQSAFALTQMMPMNYQEVFRYGSGNLVEYIFNREYMRQGVSLPKADPPRKISGGYADVLDFGLHIGRILYADVESLYPSLGKMLKIKPKKDILNLYQIILGVLKDFRFDIKGKIAQYKKDGKDHLIRQQKATDSSVKIILNTMAYGFLASAYSGFNDYDEAERITTNGQTILRKMIDVVERGGGKSIKADTDGLALLVPDKWKGKEDEYCEHLSSYFPEEIIIGNDGIYDGILTFDRKSYALLGIDGKITLKGNTITGRSVEKFYNDLIKETILYLFDASETKPMEVYNDFKEKILNHKLEAGSVQQRSSLKKTLTEYEMQRDAKECNPMAQYELALGADIPYQKGDVVLYYIKRYPYELTTFRNKPTVRKKKSKVYEAAELIVNYNYDYEPEYYMDRLNKSAKKFMVLGKDYFENLFDIEVKRSDITKITRLTKKDYD